MSKLYGTAKEKTGDLDYKNNKLLLGEGEIPIPSFWGRSKKPQRVNAGRCHALLFQLPSPPQGPEPYRPPGATASASRHSMCTNFLRDCLRLVVCSAND